jgi:CMP-N-acetylneuraminic acid synthetase
MSVLGVILARGGSKRCPGKNLRQLNGQSLLAWAMSAGMLSPSIDALVVSSDDDEILEEAQRYGVSALKRPAEMATDEASSYPALLHALDTSDYPYDYVCLLQPTSPFRTALDIEACILIAKLEEHPAVVSFTEGADVPNGAVYVGRSDWLRDGGNFDGPAVARYDMPASRSLDIDTEEDFRRAIEIMDGIATV